MTRNIKIIMCAIILSVTISFLFLVVPVTGTFIVSYIYAIISITCICTSFIIKNKHNIIVNIAYIYASCLYGVFNMFISIILNLINISTTLTFVILSLIFAFYIVKILLMSNGGDYLNTIKENSLRKNKLDKLKKEKYWTTEKETEDETTDM